MAASKYSCGISGLFHCPSGRPTMGFPARLRRAGKPIGDFDSLIAAHAMHLGIVLVTNNLREFTRVAGLRVENWV